MGLDIPVLSEDVVKASEKGVAGAPLSHNSDRYRGLRLAIPERFHGETRIVSVPTIFEFGEETVLCEPIQMSNGSVGGVVLTDGEKQAIFSKHTKDRVTVGRDVPAEMGIPGSTNDWNVPIASASRGQGQFYYLRDQMVYTDNNSTYGTGMRSLLEVPHHLITVAAGKKEAFIFHKIPVDITVGGQVLTIVPDALGYRYSIFDKNTGKLYKDASRDFVDVIKIGKDKDNDIQLPTSSVATEATITITKNAIMVKDKAFGRTTITRGNIQEAQAFVQQIEQEKEISQTLDIVSKMKLATGEPCLANADKLKQNYQFTAQTVGDFSFIYPEGQGYEKQLADLVKISQTVEQLIANPLGSAKLPIKIVLAPGSEYCARASAPIGMIVMNFEDVNKRGIFAHEYTHEYLRQLFGHSHVPTLVEGAATYFGQKAVPTDQGNDAERCAGGDEIKYLLNLQKPINPSGTKLVEDARPNNVMTDGQKYEYAYRLGTYFVGYIVEKYGVEVFRNIYANAARPQFFDADTGKQLVDKFQGPVAPQREILAALIRKASDAYNIPELSPDKMEASFTEYIRAKMRLSPQQAYRPNIWNM